MKDTVYLDALAEALVRELPKGGAERMQETLTAFATALEQDRSLRDAFMENRLQIAETKLARTLDPLLVNALALLQAKGRMADLQAFVERFKRSAERAGLGREAIVESVVPLLEKERKSLQTTLEKKWDMPVFLREKLDPALIGGLRLASGDWQFDASVRGKLKRLVQRIKA